MTQTNKISHIETLRGIAILLVVIGHVIGSTPEGGMRIDFPSPWRYLYLWIDYIHGDSRMGICAQACQSGFLRYVYEEKGISLARTDGSGRHALFLDPIHNAGHQPERKPSGYMENIRIPIHDLLVSAIPVLDVRGHPYDRCQQMDG